MENFNIKINKKNRQVDLPKNTIGNDGENLQENLVFSFDDEFVDGQGRLEIIFPNKTKNYINLTKIGETYQTPVKSVMTKTGRLDMQLVIDEGTDENSVPIFKSNDFFVIVKKSINAVEEAPEGYAQWIEIANAKLNQIDNLDIDAVKLNKTTTITITKKDGTQETTEVNDGIDGIGLNYDWQGTFLGVKREDESNYEYVNLKGDKGDAGAIKMLIVAELPSTGADDTIYLVPLENPDIQGNNYAEYVYINGAWELLGKIGVQVDLTDYALKSEIPTQLSQLTDDSTHRLVSDTEKNTWNNKLDNNDLTNYVKNTDYASNSKGGVIKVSPDYFMTNMENGVLKAVPKAYSQYENMASSSFIAKGTLENVITGKQLVNQTYVDNLVGDIASAIDLINGEVI